VRRRKRGIAFGRLTVPPAFLPVLAALVLIPG
jgi:hypothetical protein